MPGRFVYNRLREAKAFAEGQSAVVTGVPSTTNPHPAGSPAHDAWAAGWTDGATEARGLPPDSTPDPTWTKAEIRVWIERHWGRPGSGMTKAELLEMAGYQEPN